MSGGLNFDAEMARRIVAVYETQDAMRRRRAVRDALALLPGESVIDIGTGPGFLAREMADDVGPGGRVYGVDNSEPMLQLARERCAAQRWVRFQSGSAERLPVADADFDVAVSVQVFEYVANVSDAIEEMFRALKPEGRAVVVATDWDSILWHSSDPPRMQRVLDAFAEHCAFSSLPRTLGRKLEQAGFEVQDHRLVPQFNPALDPHTYSYHLLQLAGAFVVGRRGVTKREAAAWAEDLRQLAERAEYFFCLNQFMFVVAKPR